MKIWQIFLLLLSTIYSYKVPLDQCLSLESNILNPSAPINEQIVKFRLILENGASGWASIGWRLTPEKYVWGMANTDYIVCYHNDENDMGCFDAYMFFKDEIAADGTNWNDYLPRPLPDSHPAVGGTEDIVFYANESFRYITPVKQYTEWVFTRKVNTGDPLDMVIDQPGIQSVYAYTEERALWEKDPTKWNLENIGAYHQEQRGHFLFFLKPVDTDL